MTKAELIAILANYADDQLVLVESAQGFEERKTYVTAVRPRRPDEHDDANASDYVVPGLAQAAKALWSLAPLLASCSRFDGPCSMFKPQRVN